MPTFEDMKNKSNITTVGSNIKKMSNMVMNETFSNGTDYRMGKIYDCNMKMLQDIDFKFFKTSTYTISKDQVEYLVQFRPGVNPEKDFIDPMDENGIDKNAIYQRYRLGFYLDIPNDDMDVSEKWLVLGKDNSEFDKYVVLRCNWLFEWVDLDRKYHSCLGVLRDRNNYNSGVWSDGTTTTVENQTAFFVPTNNITKSIDYGIRFMLTDNDIHPKVYEITKLMDTFPFGSTKVTLAQSHYNEHTDWDGIEDMNDGYGKIHHYICDKYKSSLPLIKKDEQVETGVSEDISWSLSNINEKLYVNGNSQTIKATPNKNVDVFICEWHVFVDNEDYFTKMEELIGYLDIRENPDDCSITISAINKDLVDYIIKVAILASGKIVYDDFVEMEVTI